MKDELIATPSQTAGPFVHLGLYPQDRALTSRERVRLRISVTDGDGQKVDDALLELWDTDCFVRVATGDDGSCEIGLNRPHDSRPYINLCVFARGLLRQLQTRIYFAGAPALDSDKVLATVPAHRRGTLIAGEDPNQPGRWVFDLRLQGSNETVFFNV